MKPSPRLLAGLLSVVIVLPAASLAAKADRKKPAEPAVAFTTVDKNGDGSVTQEEFVAAMKDKQTEETAKSQFATLDKDHDGKLSKEEYAASAPEKKKRRKKNNN